MSLRPLDELPDETRLWIFGADRPAETEAVDRVLGRTREFLDEWTAHRRELRAGCGWRRDRFLLVAVDESRVTASGCSIDELMRFLRGLERETGIGLTDGSPVWFRDPRREGAIRSVPRSRFGELAREGVVGPDTTVYDLTVDRLGDLRAGAWERPARDAWHATLLPDVPSGPRAEEAPGGSAAEDGGDGTPADARSGHPA